MITLSVSAFLVVLILGLIAIVVACTRERPMGSPFWFWCAAWVTMLSLLWPGVIALH